MARPLSLVVLAALVPLSACDWSQKKPETLGMRGTSSNISAGVHQQFHRPGDIGDASKGVDAEPGAGGIVVGGQRSLRLHGRGISRKRQTLI
jgi:hypothetical protein